jgi:hypothetical protein
MKSEDEADEGAHRIPLSVKTHEADDVTLP